MSDEQPPRQALNAADFVGRLLSKITSFYAGREISNLISIAAFIDGAIVRIISVYFAADKAKASYLADNIVDRMQFDRKLKTLTYVLKQNSWENEFFELVPQLRRFFKLRDELAHSFLDDEVREEGDELVFTRYSWRDGDYQEIGISLSAITNAGETAQATILENLMMILSRIESRA